jgi:MGT family glycosyltransferase
MASVLGLTLPATGHLMSQLPVLAELARRGHEVSCMSLPRYQAMIEHFGVRFQPLPITEQDEQDFAALSTPHLPQLKQVQSQQVQSEQVQSQQVQSRGLLLLPLYACLLDITPRLLPALQDTCSTLPDVIVADAACPWSWRAARRWSRPCVTLVPSFAWTPTTLLSSPSALLDLWSQLPGLPTLMRAQARLARHEGEAFRPPWAFLEPGGERVLVLTSKALQPTAWSVPRHWRFIGPTSPAPPAQGETLRRQVYVSLGTVAEAQLSWWRAAVQALAPGPGQSTWPTLLAVGPVVTQEQLEPLPDHVRLTPWADQPKELQASRVFVTHGGMSSIGEALRLGVPMVLSPQSMDHFWVASRLHRLGAGVNIGPQPSVRRLNRAIDRVWNDPSYAQRARQLGMSLLAAGGAERAASEVEALL